MVRVIIAAVLAFVAVDAAYANPTKWTDPSGRVSLDLPEGWVILDPTVPAVRFDGNVLTTRPADDNVLGQCNVGISQRPLPLTPSRQRLNEATERLGSEMSAPAGANFVINSETVSNISGVSVFDIVRSMTHLRTIERRFLLRAPDRLELYTVACSAHNADDVALSAIDAIVASLEINEGQTHP